MRDYEVWFDGISNKDVGVKLQGAVEISAPVPKTDTITVPGTNGDLHFFDGSYKNRTAKVKAYTYRFDGVKKNFGAINKWLLQSVGYRKLVTDDDLEHYMLSRVANGAEMATRIDRLAPFEIKWDCMPQRFLTTGLEPILVESNTIIENPTIQEAKPIYRIWGSGDCELVVGGSSLQIKNLVDFVEYDADTENAYNEIGANLNHTIYAPKGLPFEAGEQPINFVGNITKIEIIPRWWEL